MYCICFAYVSLSVAGWTVKYCRDLQDCALGWESESARGWHSCSGFGFYSTEKHRHITGECVSFFDSCSHVTLQTNAGGNDDISEAVISQYRSASARQSLALYYDCVSLHQGRPHMVHDQRSSELRVIATTVPVRERGGGGGDNENRAGELGVHMCGCCVCVESDIYW